MVSARVPDLDSLALLLEIAVAGSFGRAAAAHGLSQPAVSARVQSMEALVGVALVERSPRGSSLTPAGVLVAGWARQVLDAAEVLDAGIASLRADQDQQLRVAASMTVAEHLLPRWLVRLAAARPETAVSLQAMNSTQAQQAVLAGQADLGFVEGPHLEAGLASRVVAHDRLVVVVNPTHPWARRRNVDPAELAATRLVQREPTSGTRTALEAALRTALNTDLDPDAGFHPGLGTALSERQPLAPPLLELSTSTAVCAATAAGAGPAVLSRLAVSDDLETGRLVEVRTRRVDLTRELRAVWPHQHRPTHPAEDLLHIATTNRRT